MRDNQGTFETLKQSYVIVFSVCMAVPLKNSRLGNNACCIYLFGVTPWSVAKRKHLTCSL